MIDSIENHTENGVESARSIEPEEKPANDGPIVHSAEKAPRCEDCLQSENKFFDFNCEKCLNIVVDNSTSIGQLMAIARQWTFSVQSNMNILIHEMLRRGAHPDDRDGLTDMTMLHYATKSGAQGIGNPDLAAKSAVFLVEEAGADPNLRCGLNDMTALHIAAYYDVDSIIGYLVNVIDRKNIDQTCKYLKLRTPLHIAAANLCLKSVRVLLSAGANVLLKDEDMSTPLDCVPDIDSDNIYSWNWSKDQDIALEMRTLLEEATLVLSGEQGYTDMETLKTAKVVLSALGLEIGDRVVVGNTKVGTLRYCGPTQFASGIWTGVEFDEPIGKNDGSIDGVQYFFCSPNHGIFAPINKICKLDEDDYELIASLNNGLSPKQMNQINGKFNNLNISGIDMSFVQSKIDSGLNRSYRFSESNGILSSSNSSVNSEDIHIGSRVFLADKKSGTVRFIGMTQFASGIWYGIELTRPLGKNDGSVNGVRYFKCLHQYGLFVQFPRILRILPANTRRTISNFLSQDESDETSSDISMAVSGTSSLDIATSQTTTSSDRNNANHHHYSNHNNNSNNNNGSVTLRRSISHRQNTTTSSSRLKHSAPNTSSKDQSWLRIGVNVLVNGMVAVVRYIGPVHFTDGIFLGVELRSPNGKNDGSIDGTRYFCCKPNYGLLVRPKKVTVRGINASKLLPAEYQQADQQQQQQQEQSTSPSTSSTPHSSMTMVGN